MAVLRSDIERTLDDLISNEEEMRFQGLRGTMGSLQVTTRGREVGFELRQLPRELMHLPRLVYRSTNV